MAMIELVAGPIHVGTWEGSGTALPVTSHDVSLTIAVPR
jgi:hypothetical protein